LVWAVPFVASYRMDFCSKHPFGGFKGLSVTHPYVNGRVGVGFVGSFASVASLCYYEGCGLGFVCGELFWVSFSFIGHLRTPLPSVSDLIGCTP